MQPPPYQYIGAMLKRVMLPLSSRQLRNLVGDVTMTAHDLKEHAKHCPMFDEVAGSLVAVP